MEIKPHTLYHIYNQGNNRQTIFYEERNYLYFLKNARELFHPICDTLAYCLMPNHFHFLIYTNEKSAALVKVGNIEFSAIKNAFRLLQSRYASAINKQEKRTGSLFRQKSKFKEIEVAQSINYPFICFSYIHQNPLKAQLVNKMEDWKYSSFSDYSGLRNGTFCNKHLANELLIIKPESFYEESYKTINDELLKSILK